MKRLLGLVMAVLISFFLVKPAAEPNISLPRPSRLGSGSLEQALERAETVRDYSDQPLSLLQVSTILWAAGGRRYDSETGASRTYPSAGGIYPLELYLVAGAVEGLPAGVYRYLWRSHELERLKQGDVRRLRSYWRLISRRPRLSMVNGARAGMCLWMPAMPPRTCASPLRPWAWVWG